MPFSAWFHTPWQIYCSSCSLLPGWTWYQHFDSSQINKAFLTFAQDLYLVGWSKAEGNSQAWLLRIIQCWVFRIADRIPLCRYRRPEWGSSSTRTRPCRRWSSRCLPGWSWAWSSCTPQPTSPNIPFCWAACHRPPSHSPAWLTRGSPCVSCRWRRASRRRSSSPPWQWWTTWCWKYAPSPRSRRSTRRGWCWSLRSWALRRKSQILPSGCDPFANVNICWGGKISMLKWSSTVLVLKLLN